MLDFYAIPDRAPVLDFPNEDRILGPVSMEQHEDLFWSFEAFGLETLPPYYEGARLTSLASSLLLGSLKATNWEKVPDS